MADKIYTVMEAAEIVNKSPVTVRKLIKAHGIGQRLGRDWALTDEDIKKLQAIPGPGRPEGAKDSYPRTVKRRKPKE